MRYHILVVSVVFSTLFYCAGPGTASRKVGLDPKGVRVEGGTIVGQATRDGQIYSFLGVPFAAPPVGELRWQPPAAVVPWPGLRECTAFAPSAKQPAPRPFYMWSEEFLIPAEPIAEDCLYLNVWTPARHEGEKRPVLVWIHGGGFSSGGSSVPIYDGEALARKGVVFVSINYRVGIFGFLAHPELTAAATYNSSGNYGLMDQLAALRWVRDNIASFGGDPANVTIAGQSAGAVSVACLVASPRAEGLFRRAIAQSGAGLFSMVPGSYRPGLVDRATAERTGIEVAHSLGARTLSQLRALPADTLLRAAFRPSPIIDSFVITEPLAATFRAGRQHSVDLLTGWNEDDGMLFGGALSAADYATALQRDWPAAADELLGFYPATNDSIAALAQRDLQRDLAFGAQNFALANFFGDQGRRVFTYRFDRDPPDGEQADFGAFHTAEVPYALGTLDFIERPFTATDARLADQMSSYWANFARTGDPNGPGLPVWAPYQSGGRSVQVLGESTRSINLSDAAQLQFLVDQLLEQ